MEQAAIAFGGPAQYSGRGWDKKGAHMSSILIKPAVVIASAALLSLAVLPALAQNEPKTGSTETRAQSPPIEVEQLPGTTAPHSTPRETKDTPRELRLPTHAKAPPRRCKSDAANKADAIAYCAPILQCSAGTTTDCQYRSNSQDWICSCK
jgi:hypothetical protein